MISIKSKFKIYSPIQKSNELNEDGSLILEGVASTSGIDLQGDIVSEQAMESMKEHATKLNIHANHEYDLFDGVIGHITEVLDTDEKTFKIKFIILPEYAEKIKTMLDLGIKLGLSIGGDVTNWKEIETPDGGWAWIIEDILLFEVSLTPMPANWDTFGTVTTSKGLVESNCLTGACYEVVKNKIFKNGDMMKEYLKTKSKIEKADENTEEETETGATELTESAVVDMINEALNTFKEEEIPTLKEEIKTEIIDELKQEESTEESTESTEEADKELFTEEMEKQIAENVEKEVLKKLGLEREPEPSKPEEESGEEEGEVEKSHNGIQKMSRKDIAKNLAESRSKTGLAAILQAAQE